MRSHFTDHTMTHSHKIPSCNLEIYSLHSQKQQLTPLYILISMSFGLSLYSWIDGLDDDILWSELVLLRVLEILDLKNLKCGSK